MNKPKLMICGHARHGKDEVANLLRDNHGYRVESSSIIANKMFVFDEMIAKGYKYETLEKCWEDRVNHRALWYNLISEYNKDDPIKLAKDVYVENDIYIGIRSDIEFLRARREGLFDVSVWIDASDRVDPEPFTSNSITPQMCDMVLDNNGSIGNLKYKVSELNIRSHFSALFDFLSEEDRYI